MRNLAHWIARHRKLAFVAVRVFLYSLGIIIILADVFVWPALIIILFGLFATNIVINGASLESIKEEANAFRDHCNPYPMIEAIPELLKYQQHEMMEAVLEQAYCNALNESGQY